MSRLSCSDTKRGRWETFPSLSKRAQHPKNKWHLSSTSCACVYSINLDTYWIKPRYISTVNFNQSAANTGYHMKTVLRLFEAKEIWRRGLKINAPFTLMEARHFTAIAYYMFTGNPAPNPCRQCTSTRSSGPAQDCIVAADLSGACTNCYYSGAGHACSIRVGKTNLNLIDRVSTCANRFYRNGKRSRQTAEKGTWVY